VKGVGDPSLPARVVRTAAAVEADGAVAEAEAGVDSRQISQLGSQGRQESLVELLSRWLGG
jgi:hypothetical protein